MHLSQIEAISICIGTQTAASTAYLVGETHNSFTFQGESRWSLWKKDMMACMAWFDMTWLAGHEVCKLQQLGSEIMSDWPRPVKWKLSISCRLYACLIYTLFPCFVLLSLWGKLFAVKTPSILPLFQTVMGKCFLQKRIFIGAYLSWNLFFFIFLWHCTEWNSVVNPCLRFSRTVMHFCTN